MDKPEKLREDLEEFSHVGKQKKTFDILGRPVELRLLRVEEEVAALKACNNMDVWTRNEELKVQTLSVATLSINKVPLLEGEARIFYHRLHGNLLLDLFMDCYNILKEMQVIEIEKMKKGPVKETVEGKDGEPQPQ